MSGDVARTSIVCIGPSHKTASLAARERFALVGGGAEQLTAELHEHPEVLEVVGVTTCNRSELYLVVTNVESVLPVAVAAFARLAQADPEELSTMLAVRADERAVTHLLRVAAGVESVIIGEAQIQGQLKQALDTAQAGGTCGPTLDRLFRRALEVGKLVRTATGIGVGHASVGSVAAELVARRLGSLADREVLVVGAGKMGGLAARSLRARGATHVVIANRRQTRAAHIAEQLAARARGLEELDDALTTCDAVISSTNSSTPVLSAERVARAVRARGERPLVLVDLAVPRDIEASAGELPGVHLYDLDDLEHVVSETMEVREAELAAVQDIVEEAAAEFGQWRRAQDAVPAIVALRGAAEEIRATEFARFERRLGNLAAEDRRRVEQLTHSIVNRLLHEPTVRLREAATGHATAGARPGPSGLELVASELFDTDVER